MALFLLPSKRRWRKRTKCTLTTVPALQAGSILHFEKTRAVYWPKRMRESTTFNYRLPFGCSSLSNSHSGGSKWVM
ncbi:hypothetical protein BV25DRAFT_1583927 [Artomyces pyxidatus]|uniref:Uncharacterized protein n=1 Tax=Artomyces pyxidatus TaxID=48021 RepID=A0ACB8TCA9_9AGAM|nr:hypothetical protein BV25DRAFT_1583927 [Artomyces pyxidatus]